jgi:mono/diheme cytochrome c family protein
MRRRVRVLTLLLLAGCLDTLGPSVGAPLSARCVSDDSDPGKDVSFGKDIEPILVTRCTVCHTPAGATPIGLQVGGLDLSSYATLRAGGASGTNIVVPGDPCASVLYLKLSPGPPFGSRMPLGGALSDAQLQLVHDWIAEGALDD